MSDDTFDVEAWLNRIGYSGPLEPELQTLRGIIAAHTATIPFENIDVLLGRPPKLTLGSLQRKMIEGAPWRLLLPEQNTLFQAGLAEHSASA